MSAIGTVVGISRRLAGLEEPERRPGLAEYRTRISVLLDAANSWVGQIGMLEREVQRRPELYPLALPERRMPSPDGFAQLPGGLAVCFNIPGDGRQLVYQTGPGWGIWSPTSAKVSSVFTFVDIAAALDDGLEQGVDGYF